MEKFENIQHRKTLKTTDKLVVQTGVPQAPFQYIKFEQLVPPLPSFKTINGVSVLGAGDITIAASSSANLGSVLYVSSAGSDSDLTRAGHIGNIDKPFLTLKAARDAAISGDLIYVLPQTVTFDNRDSNGNAWNAKLDDINLWKNGVSYYFSPGCKIKFYNQTVTGGTMVLFKPRGIAYETCNVFGHLEFEVYCVGADTSNGGTYLFNGITVDAIDLGYECFLQVKSIYSESMETIYISRGTTASGNAKVTIEADSCVKKYVTGQSGSGSVVIINGTASGTTEYNQNIRFLSSNYFSIYNFRGDISYNTINIKGDILKCTVDVIFQIQTSAAVNSSTISDYGVINVDVKKMYFKGPYQNIGSVFKSNDTLPNSVSYTFNLKGDCIEYEATGNAKTLFFMYNHSGSAKKVINYVGNIYTITASGETTQSLYSQGRRIAHSMGPNSFINIDGNINYNGSLVTLREAFRTSDSGTINFTGNMRGNFGCPITKCSSGTINITNSTIISEIDSSASSLISNGFCYITANGGLEGSFITSKVNIANSYIKLKNSSNYIGNGGYINATISNSTIINSGTGGGGIINQVPYYSDPATRLSPSNSTPTGKIQLINSSILVDPAAQALYYTDTTAVSVNSSTNAAYTVSTTLKGTLTTLTDLFI